MWNLTKIRSCKGFKKQIILIAIALLVLVILAIIYATNRLPHPRQNFTFVSVTPVVQQDVTVYADVIGNVQPPVTVAVKSLVDGQLLKVGFKKGEFVKKGQILFEIDPRLFEVALQQAKANLAHDQAQLTAAGLSLERNRKLLAGKYVAQQDFDQLQANYTSAEATVAADQAQVSNAALQLSYCTITAPIDGRTGDLLIDVGNLIKANDTNPLVIINQIAPIDVKFSISEKQFVLVKEYAHGVIQAKLDANPTVVKTGKISFIDNAVDTQTGMIQLKASFPNDDFYFWPGQFIRITIPLMNLKQALLLSTRAIQAGQNGSYVFLVTKNNSVKIRQIKVGPVVGDRTVITSGLQGGDLVVSEGQLNLTEGAKINY